MQNSDKYGNTIHRGNQNTDNGCHFEFLKDKEGNIHTAGGVTRGYTTIIMHAGFDSDMNILHEIFHTFGLSHPEGGASNGIFHYPPEEPNSNDALDISNTPYLLNTYK